MNELRERVLTVVPTAGLALLACMIVVGLVGCANSPASGSPGGSGGGGNLAAGGASSVYALQEPSGTSVSVLQFAAGANGSVSPQASYSLPANFSVQALAADSSGQIYVGGTTTTGQGEVMVMPPPSGGGVAVPTRLILLGAATAYLEPISMSVDSAQSLYVMVQGYVYVYSSTASGAAPPTRTITGTLTGLASVYPDGAAIDGSGNLYISTANNTYTIGTILEYAAGANGNVAPIRTITASANEFFFGVAVDASGNIFTSEQNDSSTSAPYIAEFSSTASGAATPTKTITPSSAVSTELGGVRIDGAGNLYVIEYLTSGSGSTATQSFALLAFSPTATSGATDTMTSSALTAASSQIAIK